ncbi:hypothetical protein AURDEDRAFT_52282 [Auricularia subglabra TFB-10046 SS5]|nr:hypothetical protein AURDEDRAFT_52282 [Auricularia subglabra TFB-10046 SS5]
MSAASNALLDYYPVAPANGSYGQSQRSPTDNNSSAASSFVTDSSYRRHPSSQTSPASSDQEGDDYIPSRATRALVPRLGNPVPVPHLTKKSRGRRVPTTPFVVQNGVSKNVRMYTCTVDDCGACFECKLWQGTV